MAESNASKLANNILADGKFDATDVVGNITSTGIDDNASGNAITIESSKRVQFTRARSNTLGDSALEILPSDTVAGIGFRMENTNNDLVIEKSSPSGSEAEILRIRIGGGIALGGTGDANTLDDYEEGTWTPAFANAPSATFNANGQQGYYTKVGRLVTVGFNLSISSLGGGSGGADITGLPFAASNTPTSSRYMGTIGGDDNWSTDLSGNNTVLQIYGDYLNTRIFLQKNNCNNKADIQLSDIGTSRVLGTITYFA